jgi:hypothetical protein
VPLFEHRSRPLSKCLAGRTCRRIPFDNPDPNVAALLLLACLHAPPRVIRHDAQPFVRTFNSRRLQSRIAWFLLRAKQLDRLKRFSCPRAEPIECEFGGLPGFHSHVEVVVILLRRCTLPIFI